MKVWLEQSCFSRSRKRRSSGSRHTWPAGCPGRASTPQMTRWHRPRCQCTTFVILSTFIANPRSEKMLQITQIHVNSCMSFEERLLLAFLNSRLFMCRRSFLSLLKFRPHLNTRTNSGNGLRPRFNTQQWELPPPTFCHLYCNKIYIINSSEVTSNCLGIAVVFIFSVNKSHWLDNLEHVSLPVVITYMWDCGAFCGRLHLSL